MTKSQFVDKLVGPMVLPSALLGLSSNVFTTSFPRISLIVGWISIILLCISSGFYIFYSIIHKIVPKRFANLVYVVDDKLNLATIKNPYHKRVQPPGSRLGYHEGPHEAIPRGLREELGLNPNRVEVWSSAELREFGEVEIVPTPIQVQIERNKQRIGIKMHYDYIYLCRVLGETPPLDSPLNPRWMSLEQLQSLRYTNVNECPFANIIPTFESILTLIREGREHWYPLV